MNLPSWLVQRLPGSYQVQNGQAFALGKIAAADLPACNHPRQFEGRVIPGAAGVADRTVICEKDAANAYAWNDIGRAALDSRYVPLSGISDFTNFAHDHGDADDGGNIPSTSVTGLGTVWLATNSPSAASSSNFNNVFSATYDRYVVSIRLALSAANAELYFRIRGGGSDLISAGSYSYALVTMLSNAATITGINANSITILTILSAPAVGATWTDVAIDLSLSGPFLSNEVLVGIAGGARSDTPSTAYHAGKGSVNNTTSYDGFTLLASTGTMTGTIRVYGVRND